MTQVETPAYPERITLTKAAESYLDELATDLALGKVQTHQLSPALRSFYWLSYWAGHAYHDEGCQGRINRLTWERDLFYFCYANRKKPTDFYSHLTSELWREVSL